MAKNIYDLLFAVVIFASILMITIGGAIYLVSSGNRGLAGTGKELITKTLAGFALFLLGELIVLTVLNFAGANMGVVGSGGSWYNFTCDTTSLIGSSTSSGSGTGGTGTGGTGTPTTSSCPAGTRECSKTSLESTCFKNNAESMSIICQKESSGSLTAESGTDKCTDGSSFSFGLFQISLIAHADKIGYKSSDIYEINSVPGTNHNSTTYGQCLEWSEKGYCAKRDCKVKDQTKYEAAKKQLFDKETNLRIACQISSNGSSLSPWSYSKGTCGL